MLLPTHRRVLRHSGQQLLELPMLVLSHCGVLHHSSQQRFSLPLWPL
jgi:hypothetical protein